MMQRQGHPSLREMCRMAGVSRAAYHRHWNDHCPREQDTALRARIEELALADRHYGYRRIHAALRQEGWEVNHKRVLRLMREDELLSLRRRKYIFTTESRHELQIYPNLACQLALTGINQLWVADITYIRMREEFVYAAIVLDAWSRRVIGWAVDKSLQAGLAIEALECALRSRTISGDLIHHSDRGAQYASAEYVKRLETAGITISMSRKANPWDNARAESFMRTLKAEEVDGRRYRNLEEARSSIASFIEERYNLQRLHSSLGYRSPIQFEQALKVPPPSAASGGGVFQA
jgi:transposase InsO family protein